MNLKHTQVETNTITGPTHFPDLVGRSGGKLPEHLAKLETELPNSH